MKSKLYIFSIFLVLILAFPVSASAQLKVDPEDYDFGDVSVGNSASNIITVMNLGGSEVDLVAEISGSADFAIASNVPATIGPLSVVDINVAFSPVSEGLRIANLLINDTVVSLTGVGVASTPPPTSVADILAFFDESVANGTLVGYGGGNSANGRRNALRNQIKAAGDMIDDGAISAACQQLMDAYCRCDGLERPPDFVAGGAAPVLAGMILNLCASLGCQ